ncbi:hypothetical protein CKF58_02635 [Psittacicella hinzii]|uniref:Uncharacterized protein n=2 Tax=Psittacicella hinzii TaxID=2028575 RepID=A0A3A1YNC9_9GAMM|nr:hypothetical protein CKF58_02635 [Psittacicella hinzii]
MGLLSLNGSALADEKQPSPAAQPASQPTPTKPQETNERDQTPSTSPSPSLVLPYSMVSVTQDIPSNPQASIVLPRKGTKYVLSYNVKYSLTLPELSDCHLALVFQKQLPIVATPYKVVYPVTEVNHFFRINQDPYHQQYPTANFYESNYKSDVSIERLHFLMQTYYNNLYSYLYGQTVDIPTFVRLLLSMPNFGYFKDEIAQVWAISWSNYYGATSTPPAYDVNKLFLTYISEHYYWCQQNIRDDALAFACYFNYQFADLVFNLPQNGAQLVSQYAYAPSGKSDSQVEHELTKLLQQALKSPDSNIFIAKLASIYHAQFKELQVTKPATEPKKSAVKLSSFSRAPV